MVLRASWSLLVIDAWVAALPGRVSQVESHCFLTDGQMRSSCTSNSITHHLLYQNWTISSRLFPSSHSNGCWNWPLLSHLRCFSHLWCFPQQENSSISTHNWNPSWWKTGIVILSPPMGNSLLFIIISPFLHSSLLLMLLLLLLLLLLFRYCCYWWRRCRVFPIYYNVYPFQKRGKTFHSLNEQDLNSKTPFESIRTEWLVSKTAAPIGSSAHNPKETE